MSKSVKKLCFVLFVISALALGACAAFNASSGSLVTREFDLEPFNQVQISGVARATFRQSDNHRVVVTAREGVFDRLRLNVSNNTFSHRFRGIGIINSSLELVIYAPYLVSAAFSGSSSAADWDTISGDAFSIRLSGASSPNINVNVQNLDIRASGSGRLTLNGSADNLDIRASGSSAINAFDFEAVNAELRTSGASRADVFVTDHLNTATSGSARVRYQGNPAVTGSSSGASSVRPY